MIVVICPGIHPPSLTHGLISGLEGAIAQNSLPISLQTQAIQPRAIHPRAIHPRAIHPRAIHPSSPVPLPLQLWVLPSSIAPYAPEPIDDFVEQRWRAEALPIEVPTVWIGFSAGVVGAVAAARRWQRRGGLVRGLIAVDGWGVPLGRRFPRYRLSHDRFTAQSCEWLGASDGYFYCDPAVEHLEFWRSPQSAIGHWQPNLGQSNPKSPNPGSQNQGSPQQRFPQTENRLTGDFQQLNQPCSMDAARCLAQLLWTLAQGT